MNIQTFNYLESLLWFFMAITLFIYTFKKKSTSPYKTTALTLTLALLAFAVSDIIEAQTGAWYRPFWLLLLKAYACSPSLVVIAATSGSRKEKPDTPKGVGA